MFCHKRWGAESRTGWLYNPRCIYTPPYWLLHFPPYFFSLSFSISSSFIFTRLLYTHIWSYLASKKPNPLSYIIFHNVFFCIIPSGSPQLSSTTLFSTAFFQELSFLVFHSTASFVPLLLPFPFLEVIGEEKRAESLKCLTSFLFLCLVGLSLNTRLSFSIWPHSAPPLSLVFYSSFLLSYVAVYPTGHARNTLVYMQHTEAMINTPTETHEEREKVWKRAPIEHASRPSRSAWMPTRKRWKEVSSLTRLCQFLDCRECPKENRWPTAVKKISKMTP